MAKLSLERKIHFDYSPPFVAYWNYQSQEFKNLCDELGRPYGYSGMNVFYCYLFQKCFEYFTEYHFLPWIKRED